VFAALFALLFSALAHLHPAVAVGPVPQPQEHVVTQPVPHRRSDQVPAGAGPVQVVHAPSVPAPVAVTPEPADVAAQAPGETIGREIDCADGSVGTVNAAGSVDCP
jgi:hypothetical protein